MTSATNIYLVGLMGAGKTTVGRLLAKRLQRRFVDSDHEIEARTGVRVPVIFDIEGEAGFRRREAQMIEELAQQSELVVATGGGAVLAEENRRLLRASGTAVYLSASPSVLFERTRQDRNRPLLQVPDPLARLTELFVTRDPLYREVADVVVNADSGNAATLVQQIEKALHARCEP